MEGRNLFHSRSDERNPLGVKWYSHIVFNGLQTVIGGSSEGKLLLSKVALTSEAARFVAKEA